jgi:hypothetical protein
VSVRVNTSGLQFAAGATTVTTLAGAARAANPPWNTDAFAPKHSSVELGAGEGLSLTLPPQSFSVVVAAATAEIDGGN